MSERIEWQSEESAWLLPPIRRLTPIYMQVYSDPRNVDDDLVTSIVQPAESSGNAPEVFRRIITGSGESINRLLRRTHARVAAAVG